MNSFLYKYIVKPFAASWLLGVFILAFWTVAFVALPAISGWFLAASSVAFITANALFSYLVPSSVIRLLTLLRTAARYFERLENHKTTLNAQQKLQLKVFQSVSGFSYFKKQVNNNSSILENSTHGIEAILNHILLWMLPLTTLVVALLLYFGFLAVFSSPLAFVFLFSSALFLFVLPQFIFHKNKNLYSKLKLAREVNNHALIETFRGRIEISKYNLEGIALKQHEKRKINIQELEKKLQVNSFALQMLAGLGFSLIALLVFKLSMNEHFDASLAIGVFFGVMAQAELAEMLFSGKSERNAVAQQIKDLDNIFDENQQTHAAISPQSDFETLTIHNFSAHIPETTIYTEPLLLEIAKGDWIALYGSTGKGKSTFLNGLFYPEYCSSGELVWNNQEKIKQLPVPQCIYVTQKAYLLTGTLFENFEGYAAADIIETLELVDLGAWYKALPQGLDTWIGENGETLSGGQRKKILLAQALLKKPALLVVDEPTAGISTENAIEIFKNIKAFYPSMTILMATHLPEFESVADKVIKM